jgi:hypothetical protein
MDPGIDDSVPSGFRARASTGAPSERTLEERLTHGQAQGLQQAGGRQRIDATHVLAAARALNRIDVRQVPYHNNSVERDHRAM